MKIVTVKDYEVVEGVVTEGRGVVQTLHNEPVPGFFRRITLGGAGLTIRNPKGDAVHFPLEMLIACAEKCAPGLVPPRKAEAATPPIESPTQTIPPVVTEEASAAPVTKPKGILGLFK